MAIYILLFGGAYVIAFLSWHFGFIMILLATAMVLVAYTRSAILLHRSLGKFSNKAFKKEVRSIHAQSLSFYFGAVTTLIYYFVQVYLYFTLSIHALYVVLLIDNISFIMPSLVIIANHIRVFRETRDFMAQ